MSQWKVFVQQTVINPGDRIVMIWTAPNGERAIVNNMTMERIEDHQLPPDSSVIPAREAEQFLRAMLNAAWDVGLRPDGFNDTRESMKATDAHLQDMRALAFHKIGAPKP